MPEILKAAEEAGRGGWEVVIQQALKRPDKCLTFGEIKRLYRRDLNSEMLRNRGFVNKGKGIWCYVGEQTSEQRSEIAQGQ
ncbi:MAG: hypothetical protein JZD41_05830 [Thermoproteus sp.]|nr:hypothetical protein [Thermoproteus sp.]